MSEEGYNSRSLDRHKQKSSRRASRKGNQPSIVIRRSGSQEEVYTGTRVTEIPENFLVHIEPRKENEHLTDIDPNSRGSSDSLLVEGKVELSETMRRRISRKGGRPGSKKGAKQDVVDGGDKDTTDTGKNAVETLSKPVIRCENENGYLVSSTLKQEHSLETQITSLSSDQLASKEEEEGDETLLRNSTASTDSGIAEASEKELASHGTSTENSPTELLSLRNQLTPPRNSSFDTLRFRNKDRDSMLLSQLCVIAVTLPADIIQGQKGKGAMLKFRFSPYTQIEALRVAILKQFNERFDVPVEKLSKLHLFRYLEEEEGWEYLEEDQSLQDYNLHNESKLELKSLSSSYRDMRVVIPQLECSLSVEFDQFSTVGDVLRQVLDLSQPQLDPTEGYTLYHVRLRMTLDPMESMVFYHILSSDVLECRLAVGKLHEHSVILTIKIPSIQSSRKVKVCLDETVGELMSTLMRRVPDPESNRWAHMSLYLRPKNSSVSGMWMEDYKFLAAYKLKATDVIEFRPKYRPMKFELKVYPHDHEGDNNVVYATPELLIAQDSFVSDVIDLLCNSCALEYDPRLYGLYLHDDQQLPQEMSMWDYLDDSVPGYQDSIVLHMVHKPIVVSLSGEDDSVATLNVDFSQPCKVLRNILCRRYGCRYHTQYGLVYEGATLNLQRSLHNQGVCEQEKIVLVKEEEEDEVREEFLSSPVKMQLLRKDSQSCLMERDAASRESLALVEDDANIWDEGEDSELNIRFDKKKPGVVVGASFNKLVERITSVTDHDLEFVKTFLLTYQSFATPDKLLRKLIERYNVVRPSHMSVTEFSHMRQTIQARVINALRLWVEYGVDFKDNVTLQNNILHFISTVLVLDHARLCRPLRTNILSIRGVIQKKNVKMFRDPAPPVKFPSTSSPVLSVFDFDPEEIARQLTIIDFSLFAKIKPAELLNQAWQKQKYRHRAQNILRLVERMNNLTLWVATTILSQRDITNRTKRIATFVQVSAHLHQMHNYCTLLSVLNGLVHHSVTRLKKCFAKLDRGTRAKLDELETLARPGDHFKALRDELKKASNPCIPYLGLYMSDLTFLDNGNPNFHSDSLINFSKCRLIYHQIRDLILRQDKPYNFEEVPALHESLMKFNFLDSDTLYDVSLQREPKDKDKK